VNDSQAYFEIHKEMFWRGNHVEYREAGGYAHRELAVSPRLFNQKIAELNYPMLTNNVYDKVTKKTSISVLCRKRDWRRISKGLFPAQS